MSQKSTKSASGAIGVILIVAGILVALSQFFDFSVGRIPWPLFIIVPGLVLSAISIGPGLEGRALAIIGAMTTATGLLLAYQSTFNHFESWAYAWALVSPGAIGVGLLIHAKRFGDQSQASLAIKLISTGAVLFAIGVVFFEVLINISGRSNFDGGINGYVFPAVLVGIGVVLLMARRRK